MARWHGATLRKLVLIGVVLNDKGIRELLGLLPNLEWLGLNLTDIELVRSVFYSFSSTQGPDFKSLGTTCSCCSVLQVSEDASEHWHWEKAHDQQYQRTLCAGSPSSEPPSWRESLARTYPFLAGCRNETLTDISRPYSETGLQSNL